MTNIQWCDPSIDLSAHSANPPDFSAELDESDLETWLSQDEGCAVLGFDDARRFRRLREMAQKGEIERRYRPCAGRRSEPCYRPSDVARLAAKNTPPPAVFSASSGVGPRQTQTPATEVMAIGRELASFLEQFSERLFARLPQLPEPKPVDRGPWLTIPAASKKSGLSERCLHRVWRRLAGEGSQDVTVDAVRKIRSGAVDALDATALQLPAHPAKNAESHRQMGQVADD